VESAQTDIPAQHPEQQAQHPEQQASRLRGPAGAFILTPHVYRSTSHGRVEKPCGL